MAKFQPSKNLIFGIIIALIVVVFAFQNNDAATLKFWKWSVEASTAVIFIFSASIGSVITLLITIPTKLQKEVQLISLKKQVKKLEKELGQTSTKLDEIAVEKLQEAEEKEPQTNESI